MSNKYSTPTKQDGGIKKSILNKKPTTPPWRGTIPEELGEGDNARNSIVYLVIKWSFLVGGFITYAVIMNCWFFRSNEKAPDIIGDVKSAWTIVIPIITLALGYAFGKSEK